MAGKGASIFESKSSGNYASAASGFMAQRVGKRFHFNENYYRPLHSVRSIPTLSVVSEERLTRRVLFNQFATHANGQWNVNYGGSIQWDRLAVDVGYSTSFAPLAPGGGRFEQSMNVNGHLHLGRWMLGVRSYVQPDGRVGYASDVRSYYYRPIAGGSVQVPVSTATGGLGNFLIAGEVRMEGTGKPVADVPIRIGDETVYTDNHGAFSLRVTRKHPYKIHPILDRVIGFHFYELVNGPEQVIPSTDDQPDQVQFVVRLNGKVAPTVPAGGMVVGEKSSSSAGTGSSSQPDGSSAGPGNGKGTVPEKPATEQMPKENPSLAAIPQSSKSEAVVD